MIDNNSPVGVKMGAVLNSVKYAIEDLQTIIDGETPYGGLLSGYSDLSSEEYNDILEAHMKLCNVNNKLARNLAAKKI